jgi:hypothetical protein
MQKSAIKGSQLTGVDTTCVIVAVGTISVEVDADIGIDSEAVGVTVGKSWGV